MEKPENPIIGKWQQPEGQPYAGLWFEFRQDDTFQEVYAEMGISSAGTFVVCENQIYLDQTQHSLGLVGKFEGRFWIDSRSLMMSIVEAGEKTPVDITKARLYLKQ